MRRPKVKSAVAGLLTASCLVGLSFESSGQLTSGQLSSGQLSSGQLASGQLGGAAGAGTGHPVKLTGADLVSYASCAQMLRQVTAEALKEVGPYGLVGTAGDYPTLLGTGVGVARALAPTALLPAGSAALQAAPVSTVAQDAAPSSAAPVPVSSATGQPGYSTTNDQEASVDEPDMVKTNGQIMVVLRQQPLGAQVVDVSGPVPQLEGFLALPQLASAAGLFLVGQDVVVVGQMFQGAQVSTDIIVVSVADPDNPVVQRTFSFDGELQGARLINGQVVLALTDQPRMHWFYPVSATAAAQKAATAANKAVIESSKASDWLPSEIVRPTGSSSSAVARTASCAGTYHTVIGSGLGTLSVVSFDPATNSPGNEVTVMGNAENVYASTTQVFVATSAWPYQVGPVGPVAPVCPPLPGEACPMLPAATPRSGGTASAGTASAGTASTGTASTDIYGFDISDPEAPRYLGSGSVPGTLVGQYAMSELDGYLRVATTVGEPTPAPVDGEAAPAQPSDNMVSVLQPQDGDLVTVGSLHGLGEGEKIYAVRFMGDLAYVVTFDQTDPLYVLDLSNPDHPVLAGQVSLSGYSSLLQPLSPGLLLGVGQSVDQQLRMQGLQVEVFNVADPSQPSLVSRQQLGDGAGSAAEYDPHALLWWPQDNLLVIPVENYSGAGPSSAADVWAVSPAGTLEQVGTLSQPGSGQDGYPEIERAVVVGGDLYTLSEQGVMVNDLSSLSQVAWLGYQDAS